MIWTHFKRYFCPRYNISYPGLLLEVPVGGSSWKVPQWCPLPRIRALEWLPPPECAGPMTSFEQTEYGQRDGVSFPNISYRSQTSALLTPSPALSIAPLMKPATTSWGRGPSGKEPRAASSQQLMRHGVPQANNRILPTAVRASLEADPSHSSWADCSPRWHLIASYDWSTARDPAGATPRFLAQRGITCYTAIDN